MHAEREALIDDLAGLDVHHWQHPSLCTQWAVRDVLAHLVDSARTTRRGFLVGLARARFDFDRQNDRGVEAIVHGEDIRRPLGITRTYPQDAVVRALRLQARTSASFGGAKGIVARVRVRAVDAGISIGQGPEARRTALSLLVALTGRRVALADLAGPGAAALAELT